jgi:hypothetical protein
MEHGLHLVRFAITVAKVSQEITQLQVHYDGLIILPILFGVLEDSSVTRDRPVEVWNPWTVRGFDVGITEDEVEAGKLEWMTGPAIVANNPFALLDQRAIQGRILCSAPFDADQFSECRPNVCWQFSDERGDRLTGLRSFQLCERPVDADLPAAFKKAEPIMQRFGQLRVRRQHKSLQENREAGIQQSGILEYDVFFSGDLILFQ